MVQEVRIKMYGYEIFHDELLNTLISNVRKETTANTYIFEGAGGLHKYTAAQLFANALVCESTQSAPCGECSACIEARAGSHPDIITVEKEKDKTVLSVDVIRSMINECMVKPFQSKRKVFIIREGDLLNPQAQNAFLKIIEEPPEYAVFIIVCTDSEQLLQTVRSRSVTVSFLPVNDNIVRKYIEEKYPDDPRTDFLVRYCAGIPTAADNIITSEDFEKLREETLSLVPKILSQKKLYAFSVSDYLEANKDSAAEIYDLILTYLRDALIVSMGKQDLIINADKSDKINKLAAAYSPALIAAGIDNIVTAKKMLERHVKVSATALYAALKSKI